MLKQVKKERKSKFLERLRSLFKREEKLIESIRGRTKSKKANLY